MSNMATNSVHVFKGSNPSKYLTVANTLIVLLASHTNLDVQPSGDFSPEREVHKIYLNPFAVMF